MKMNRPPNFRVLAVAAGLLLTLALGACGSDDNASTSAPDTPAGNREGEGGDDAGGEAATEGDAVDIKDFNYLPANLKVKAGTEVTFTNSDGFAHTVTARDKSFDSGNMDKDAVFKQTFDKAGTYEYFCSIHNSMTGKVTVE